MSGNDDKAAQRDRAAGLAAPGSPARCACGDTGCRCLTSTDPDRLRELATSHGRVVSSAEELLRVADLEFARSVPRRYLERQRVIPITRDGSAGIVATCDVAADVPELAEVLGVDAIDYRVVSPTDYRRLRLAIDVGQAGAAATGAGDEARPAGDLAESGIEMDEGLVALFHSVLLEGIAERASDIHLERYGERVRVRVRIDGDLHDVEHFHLSPAQLVGVMNVLKVSADLDITERRQPQGGRMSTTLHGRRYDIRVQTQPALYGEHAVMRILPQQMKILTIEDLGLDGTVARVYRRLLDTPAGMVLIVGPTGSGKTTTLYAGLQVLAQDATRKVVTVEDPVEYAIEGIQQSPVRPELGFAFSQAMRAFVREDPDVILVGEIRDEETALEAIRASQTGHLVLSTLHCNDSVDAIQRLRDLGMHLNSLASELLAVLAQRLAKRNCAHCRAVAVPPQDLAEEVFPEGIPADFCCFRGAGCARCHDLGTFGRIAVAELLSSGPELRRAVSRGATLDELRAVALASGLEPMREHLLRLVHAGTVPFTELRALLPPERLGPEGRPSRLPR